jgi:methionyl-tRNA formyltransferase
VVRIAFFGTPQFAVPSLQRLIDSDHQIVAAVTQPDRARGRGQRIQESPVKALAASRGIPVLQPERLKEAEFGDPFRALGVELSVVAAYGKILPQWLIGAPGLGTINVHASLLPKFRGAAPVHRAVMAGEPVTGVTIMRVVLALDAGPMLAQEARAIGPDETSEEVERALADLGADLLLRTLGPLAAGLIVEIEQDAGAASYAARLTKEDGIIDWHRPAAAIHNQVRGLHPWPLASTWLASTRYVIRRTRPDPGRLRAAPPGAILAARGDDLAVAAGDGVALQILELQLEGRRPMAAREFLAGHRLDPGSVLRSTPQP